MQIVNLPITFPGINSLFMSNAETTGSLNTLVETLLHSAHPKLSVGERELAAAYVSRLNYCKYCCTTHGAQGPHRLGENAEMIKRVIADPESAPISNRLKALLNIAESVRSGHNHLRKDVFNKARNAVVTDAEIYDIILIADAFCMYNCYVAGLEANKTEDVELYENLRDYACEEYLQTAFTLANNDLY
jgi:uncharacterized peroxidase-related enzyme